MNTENKQLNPLDKLKEWWVIIIFIGGLIVGWTNFDNRISILEKQQSEQNPVFIQLQKDIVEIKTILSLIQIELKQ